LRGHNLEVKVQRSRLCYKDSSPKSCLRMEQFTIFCRQASSVNILKKAGRLESGCGFFKASVSRPLHLQVTSYELLLGPCYYFYLLKVVEKKLFTFHLFTVEIVHMAKTKL